ncbi:hypothetical protein GQ600_8221 [Phytophthora cactorum]|nr:hypothetical protein GQ600_8221 [Phytophthora cactorum]
MRSLESMWWWTPYAATNVESDPRPPRFLVPGGRGQESRRALDRAEYKTKCILLLSPKDQDTVSKRSLLQHICDAVSLSYICRQHWHCHANKTAASANKTSADTASGNKAPVLTIEDLLFDDAKSIDDTEAMLLTCGAKQLRTACYLRQLRIVKKGSGCNDHKMAEAKLRRDAEAWFGGWTCQGACCACWRTQDSPLHAASAECDVLRPVFKPLP